MSVSLHGEVFGSEQLPAMVMLHGLLGSGRNWGTVARALEGDYAVHVVHLRNHGQSPHAESMRWTELVGDLEAYREKAGLESFILLGHSLGGKIAMRYACEHAERGAGLVVVDIAAKAYPPYHENEFRAMRRMAVGDLLNRKEAEALLSAEVPDWALRQFLLTNLVRDESTGIFKWQINLEALHASLPHVRQNSLREGDCYAGPSLLVRGGRSDFVTADDVGAMRAWLPDLKEAVLTEAGHNVHVEDRTGFLASLRGWLEGSLED
ncbi:MAG: alpha/beta fold hydrolase [Verrucomicrobia bacterium]|nr:alpha/beta fold hydrolase [Verrucomicrobiota bacterium]